MDLSQFFDRVQHDVLMARVARKVRDKRLLKLIGRYLRAGVMADGLCQPSTEGTMQGGPLSPLLSNIYLDDLDKELGKRGLPFVRYADDFVIWIRRRVRACYWKQWRKSKTRLKKLISLGVSYRVARGFAMSGKGPWRLAMTSGVQRALSNEYLADEGLLNLEERWEKFAPLRRTA